MHHNPSSYPTVSIKFYSDYYFYYDTFLYIIFFSLSLKILPISFWLHFWSLKLDICYALCFCYCWCIAFQNYKFYINSYIIFYNLNFIIMIYAFSCKTSKCFCFVFLPRTHSIYNSVMLSPKFQSSAFSWSISKYQNICLANDLFRIRLALTQSNSQLQNSLTRNLPRKKYYITDYQNRNDNIDNISCLRWVYINR